MLKRDWSTSDKAAIALACSAGILMFVALWFERTPFWAAVTVISIALLSIYPVIHFAAARNERIILGLIVFILIGLFGWRIWPPAAVKTTEAIAVSVQGGPPKVGAKNAPAASFGGAPSSIAAAESSKSLPPKTHNLNKQKPRAPLPTSPKPVIDAVDDPFVEPCQVAHWPNSEEHPCNPNPVCAPSAGVCVGPGPQGLLISGTRMQSSNPNAVGIDNRASGATVKDNVLIATPGAEPAVNQSQGGMFCPPGTALCNSGDDVKASGITSVGGSAAVNTGRRAEFHDLLSLTNFDYYAATSANVEDFIVIVRTRNATKWAALDQIARENKEEKQIALIRAIEQKKSDPVAVRPLLLQLAMQP